MRCLMLTRSNIVSNMLNKYCSQLDHTQKRMLRPAGEFSAERLAKELVYWLTAEKGLLVRKVALDMVKNK